MLNYRLYLFSLKTFQQSNELIWLSNFSFTTNVFELLAFSPDTEFEENKTVGISYEIEIIFPNLWYQYVTDLRMNGLLVTHERSNWVN